MKQCSSCLTDRPVDDFEKHRTICRTCRNLQKQVQKYNIDIQGYNELFAKQEGCCAICKKHQSEFEKTLAIDHDHVTGKVRGLLCMFCNTALGKFKDDETLLFEAINYLRSTT